MVSVKVSDASACARLWNFAGRADRTEEVSCSVGDRSPNSI